MQNLDAKWILHVAEFCSESHPKSIYSVPVQETAKHRAQFGWPLLRDVGAVTKPAKMQNPLKLGGVPQTQQQISAVSGKKFTILWRHVEEILLFNKFFFWLSIDALIVKI